MRKLLRGIVEFRKSRQPSYRERFAELALGQRPDALFVACSDSRVVPNLFASTEPGDLFVIRNVGNLIPVCDGTDVASTDAAEGAAIEFALRNLPVRDIVICGHSECGAMNAICSGAVPPGAPHLESWLKYARPALGRSGPELEAQAGLSEVNRVSQWNVLQQLEHLRSYRLVRERLEQGTLRLHGWWFDIHQADVYAYDPEQRRFLLIDEREVARIERKERE